MPPEEIPAAVAAVCSGLATLSATPVVAAFYLFAALVYFVHPFEDGNGRLSRLLCNIVLRRAGYSFVLQFGDKIVTFAEFVDKFISECKPPPTK